MLYPPDWKSATEPEELAIILKDRMLSLDLNRAMTCRDITKLRIQGNIGSSSKKLIENIADSSENDYNGYGGGGGYYDRNRNRKMLGVKSQSNDVQTKIACMKQIYDAEFCGPMGNYLLLREVFLFHYLQHPSLIGVHGYCLRGDHVSMEMAKKGVVMVMEVGEALTSQLVNTLSFAKRVQVSQYTVF